MRKTYIYVNGELVEKGSKEHYDSLGPMVMPDIQPYKSMIDGSMITSRSVESRPPPPKDTRREVMRQQLGNMTHKQANQILTQLRRKFT